jgi:hypothetical protein
VGLERIERVGREDHRHAAGLEDSADLADGAIVVGHVLEHFVDQRDVEAIVGEVERLEVPDRHASGGNALQTLGGGDLLRAVLDPLGVGAERRECANVLACAAPAVDHAPAAQRARGGHEPVEALLQVEWRAGVAAGGLDLELRQRSRVIKLDVSWRPPPICCTSA